MQQISQKRIQIEISKLIEKKKKKKKRRETKSRLILWSNSIIKG